MALLLLPKLRSTLSPDGFLPHLCILNSLATQEIPEEWDPIDQPLIERLNDVSRFDYYGHYHLVKLSARYFMQELAAKLHKGPDRDKLVVNACCPGMCRTNLLRNFPLILRIAMAPWRLVCGRTAEQGSWALVSATALRPESNGKLWLHDELPE